MPRERGTQPMELHKHLWLRRRAPLNTTESGFYQLRKLCVSVSACMRACSVHVCGCVCACVSVHAHMYMHDSEGIVYRFSHVPSPFKSIRS